MLLRFFRINDPYRLLGLLVLLIAISLIFIIDRPPLTVPELKSFIIGEAVNSGQHVYTQIIDPSAPVITFLYGIVEWVFGRSIPARQIIALVLIFLEASFFTILLINTKAYNDSTYVPGLIFGILCFLSFDILSFSPELVGSAVLLLALNYLFKEIEFRSERDEITLNLGTCLGIATLILFSYIIFLLITIAILFVFTRPSARKVMLLLFGFLLPHVLIFMVYYFRRETDALWSGFYGPNLTVHGTSWMTAGAVFFLCIVPLGYLVFSIFMLNREARFTKYQSQLFQVMIFWMLAGFIQLFTTRDFSSRTLIIFIPSLSYFISHYLLLIRRKWLGELMLWLFIISILGVNILSRYERIPAISYSRLIGKSQTTMDSIHDKNVMMASEGVGVFRKNKQAGYFIDWDLSRNVLEHPEYYENVILVSQSMRSFPPDIIVDPRNLLKGFFARIPELRSEYVREGDFYKRIEPKKP